ncbi:MAG: GH1 family beta-glucosidase [Cellulomonas sp.]|uniref:GH1 family beta-glucosidase n=1 Tax=Cellulomonas sp. TaxID=40001 RepID=UPI002589EDE7|nr:GH1 family beta-glucosidase [Cellulomonas sp.]MCR6705786.1 GH1 family beta-glucosidase [Cellulomonas sp.]
MDQLDRTVPEGRLVARRTVLEMGCGLVGLGLLAACADDDRATLPGPTPTTWTAPAEPLRFPEGFVWGSATSAFQVEGSTTADGRGVSIWDTFAAQPGRIDDGSTGDPAADQYRRWESDLDLMVDLGLQAYRFSVAWPRIVPAGSGEVNQKGIDHYRRLVDGLLDRGLHPAITLYHWDLPQPLQDAGGWAVRDTVDRFAEYAAVMFEALRDVDATWLTINEPKTTAMVGYAGTEHAPAVGDLDAGLAAVHHQLLAHGKAVEAFRAVGGQGSIGIALNLMPVYGAPGAEAAASRLDAAENRLYLDPLLRGEYPDEAIGSAAGQLNADRAAFDALVLPGDLAAISAPCDLLAVQYYGVAGIDKNGTWLEVFPPSPAGWQQVHAEGLYEMLVRLTDDYADLPPLIISENGIPDPDAQGQIEDPQREEFLRTHLQQAARAVAEGVDLRQYYAWSFLDNFEWARGMTQRWGIVHVDYETQRRTPKASAQWYSGVVKANAVAPV